MYKIINKKKHLLPESGPLDGYLENDDVVEFELSSLDIWLEVINTSNYENSAKFEIKVDSELSICELKSYLQKWAIIIWNQIQMHNPKNITFYFLD